MCNVIWTHLFKKSSCKIEWIYCVSLVMYNLLLFLTLMDKDNILKQHVEKIKYILK